MAPIQVSLREARLMDGDLIIPGAVVGPELGGSDPKSRLLEHPAEANKAGGLW